MVAPTRRETPQREPLRGVVDDTARAMLGVAGHAGLFAQSASVYRLGQALLDCYHDEDTAGRSCAGTAPRHRAALLCVAGAARLAGTWGLLRSSRSARPEQAGFVVGGNCGRGGGVGHLGFTGCSIWIDPQIRLVAVLLSNRVFVATTTRSRCEAISPACPASGCPRCDRALTLQVSEKENLAAAKQFGRG
ncbi:MAG: serine hydrolase [Polyangia bacterium]